MKPSRRAGRRDFLRMSGYGALAVAMGAAALPRDSARKAPALAPGLHSHGDGPPMPGFNREVDHVANGFNPTDTLTDFDYGVISTLHGGRTLREYRLFSGDKDIEVAPGAAFPAWVYNGRLPGPTLRAR
ncbi:MAG: twin-arginine translocation signal domain-containing protein, partial [Armatimonadetes bacterium]|nr:twin-arginine translocation signal domain-containing protein [Armatimonadota bacterium]